MRPLLQAMALSITLTVALHMAGAATALQANRSIAQDINATAAYLQTANESGYLIFYPNLTRAYALLNQARNYSQTRPSYATLLLDESMHSAAKQISIIESYAYDATIAVLAMICVTIGALLFAMRSRPGSRLRMRRPRQS